MSDTGLQLDYARRYFRRICSSNGVLSLSLLRTHADAVAQCAMEEVLITSQAFEGGTASGVAKFPKYLAGLVLEELILEADTSLPRETDRTVAVFRTGTTTV